MLDLLALLAGAAAVPRDPDFLGPAPLPVPTSAPPGSARKVRVLANRFRLRQELWHPDDAREDGRLAFAAVKNAGPHGEKYRAGTLVESFAGAAENY
jgi:hypothetical protein